LIAGQRAVGGEAALGRVAIEGDPLRIDLALRLAERRRRGLLPREHLALVAVAWVDDGARDQAIAGGDQARLLERGLRRGGAGVASAEQQQRGRGEKPPAHS
jgi:hypothetical protein